MNLRISVTVSCILLAVPSVASAYEDQVTLGVEAGYAHLTTDDDAEELPGHAALAGLTASIGLDDIWSIRARLEYGYLPEEGAALGLALASVELLYLVDIVELVPFFGAGLDGAMSFYDGESGVGGGAHAVAGVEYLFSRGFLMGFDLRATILAIGVGEADIEPFLLSGLLRAELIFDL